MLFVAVGATRFCGLCRFPFGGISVMLVGVCVCVCVSLHVELVSVSVSCRVANDAMTIQHMT